MKLLASAQGRAADEPPGDGAGDSVSLPVRVPDQLARLHADPFAGGEWVITAYQRFMRQIERTWTSRAEVAAGKGCHVVFQFSGDLLSRSSTTADRW